MDKQVKDEDKDNEIKRREQRFQVGVNISEEGRVHNSFGLRHMQRLRQILQYAPTDERFNRSEVNDILNKEQGFKVEWKMPPPKSPDIPLIRLPQLNKKHRYKQLNQNNMDTSIERQ